MGASVGWASGVAWLEKKEKRPKKPIGDPIDRKMKRSRRKNEEQSLTNLPVINVRIIPDLGNYCA